MKTNDTKRQESRMKFEGDLQSKWLLEAAKRHESKSEPVWALLYRNEAMRIEAI
jgi:hypothetical protein